MDPQRAMIYFNSMPRPVHSPALLLGEPMLSPANPALQWPSNEPSTEPCQCTPVQKRRPGPSQYLAAAPRSCFINQHPPKSLKVTWVQAQAKVQESEWQS